jgi:nitrous oxidase accessory protein NosD
MNPMNPHKIAESSVDQGLIAAFLRQSPEERMAANDAAVRSILELQHAFPKLPPGGDRSKRPA